MSQVSAAIIAEQEQEKRLEEAIAKALDFSEIHASIARAEQLLEEAKKLSQKETSK